MKIRSYLILFFLFFCSFSPVSHAAPLLSRNDVGYEVKVLQQMLIEHGFSLKVTGLFNQATEQALCQFQKQNNLPATGKTDRTVWHLLEGDKVITPQPIKSPPKTTQLKTPLNTNHLSKNTQLANDKTKISPTKTTNKIKISSPPKKISTKPTSAETKHLAMLQRITRLREANAPESKPFVSPHIIPGLINTARQYLGVPYVYGGTTPQGFDCSGFVEYVFKKHDITLPRTADIQYDLGEKKAVPQLSTGDLVFFATDGEGISHCGIYLGDGSFIHASSSRGIRVDKLDNVYWKKFFITGKHIVNGHVAPIHVANLPPKSTTPKHPDKQVKDKEKIKKSSHPTSVSPQSPFIIVKRPKHPKFIIE